MAEEKFLRIVGQVLDRLGCDHSSMKTNVMLYLEDLPEQAVYLLTAVMYLGRGDDDPPEDNSDLDFWYHYVRDTFQTPAIAASQMLGKSPLSEYLRDGVEVISRQGLDLDSFYDSLR
jgi:hypothetical protein